MGTEIDCIQDQESQYHPQDQLTIEQLNPSPLTMVWIEDQVENTNEQESATQQEDDQTNNSSQDQLISDQEFQQELQRQEQIDKEGDVDYETDVQQDPQVPQRITRSKNNIYKKNKRYDDDYV